MRMRRSGAWLAAAACLTALAACGGSASRSEPTRQSVNEWVANAADVIAELQRDVLLSTTGGSTLAAARHTLHDSTILYTILIAYTDFGGCIHMVSSLGAAAPQFEKVEAVLMRACAAFEHAGALFTHAVTASDPHSLLAATRLALRTWPVLARASDELQAATRCRGNRACR
jgi:hypothetical protein